MTGERSTLGDDAGLTMIELVFYMVLLSVVLLIAGGMLVSSLTTQRDVGSLTSAASVGQLVASNVEMGIRNASTLRAESPTALGQLLRSRSVTATGTGVSTWQCRAWYLAGGGNFYTTQSTSGMVAAPSSSADLAAWTLLAQGVSVPTGTSQAFTGSDGQVNLAIQVAAGNARPILISTTIASRPQANTGTVPTTCF
ncbi:MAG: hypothetical protein ACYCZY_02735 [Lacisediminihabitans sp.]